MSGIEIVDNPPLVKWMLNGVVLDEGVRAEQLGVAYDGRTSLNMLAREEGGRVALLGWLANGLPYDSPPHAIQNVTNLEDLPVDFQNLDIVGKGVGSRLYNTQSAALGALVSRRPLGLYAAEVNRAAVLDARIPSENGMGGKLFRIAQHAGKIAAIKTGRRSLEEVVDRVHRSYADADAVIWKQPPAALLRQYSRGGTDQVLVPTFAIIRTPGVLHRAGVQTVT